MFALAGLTVEIEALRIPGDGPRPPGDGPHPPGEGFVSTLRPFERPGRGELNFRLCVCGTDAALPLRVVRCGDEHACAGDGINGRVSDLAADLCVVPGAEITALRLACALWLLPRAGLLLHGACVEHEGRGHVFVGRSGAGKTTLAGRLSARVISDEVTCLKDGRVHGHPFQSRLGDGRAPGGGLPLGSIATLSRGEPRRERLSGAAAGRALLNRIFLPARDARSIALALDTASAFSIDALTVPLDERAISAALPRASSAVLPRASSAVLPRASSAVLP